MGGREKGREGGGRERGREGGREGGREEGRSNGLSLPLLLYTHCGVVASAASEMTKTNFHYCIHCILYLSIIIIILK